MTEDPAAARGGIAQDHVSMDRGIRVILEVYRPSRRSITLFEQIVLDKWSRAVDGRDSSAPLGGDAGLESIVANVG